MVSTGAGILGNNMFAYCNNSPVFFTDSSGQALVPHTYATSDCSMGLELPYITDQDDPGVAHKPFGLANVSHSGCGAVASYNALLTMGYYTSFDDVLAYYNSQMCNTLGFGLMGLIPYEIAGYFSSLGFTVVATNQKDQIDLLSQTADGCIMYYKFPCTYNPLGLVSFDAYGAHFIEYSRTDNGYMGRNTSEGNGTYDFSLPSNYGSKGSRYGIIGIFIFE